MQSSLFDSRDFIGRISLGQELKLIYATRATRGYQIIGLCQGPRFGFSWKPRKGGVVKPRKNVYFFFF